VKSLDRYLRDARLARAKPHVPAGARVLDVGCDDGELFRRWRGHIAGGVGLEPMLAEPVNGDGYELRPGRFPDDLPSGEQFDVITMLAVLEHLPPPVQAQLAEACARLLKPGGRVVITVPSPRVDDILHVLLKLRLIDGINAHEHYGFMPADTLKVFPAPAYRVVKRGTFQLRLNNLFVFEKAA
jgi:2-polyprenyl-3-methyl-5-hydroxy-6-metoxy-1,4-benzoquinol methylase